MVTSPLIEFAGEGPSPGSRIVKLCRREISPKKPAVGQHAAIGQQCRGMEIPPVIEAAGEGPCASSRVVEFRACAISVIPTRNQYLAVAQQGSRMISAGRGEGGRG